MLAAGRSELSALGLKDAALDYLRAPDWAQVERDLVWLQQPSHHLLCLNDPAYPPLLRQTDAPPPVLFVRGDLELLQTYQIAIVGTRHPTTEGRRTAYDFAAHLAGCGVTVTSGLALGIDAEAHRGALAQGRTVAVMGTGLNRVYPAANRELARQIAEQGALVSELPLDTPAAAANFPRRNRIISGLALGTLVVEAAVQSGSLITARLAGEQGREVFAIPGSIHNPQARGCHSLIRQGAKLVETAADILEELGPLAAVVTAAVQSQPGSIPAAVPDDLDPDYQNLLNLLTQEPAAIDTLVERSRLTVDAVSSMLLILELQGYVAAAPGGLYSRID